MSNEAAAAFVERLKGDEDFQSRLADAASPAERLAIAREEGFDVSSEDVGALIRTLGIDELSDEDLEKVAGGAGTTTVATVAVSGSVAVGAVAGEVAAAIV
jgi:predicted ribosomally synthesized peptide with nif11-like leader